MSKRFYIILEVILFAVLSGIIRLWIDLEAVMWLMMIGLLLTIVMVGLGVKSRDLFKKTIAYLYPNFVFLIALPIWIVLLFTTPGWDVFLYLLFIVETIIFSVLNFPLFKIFGEFDPNRTMIDEEYY